MDGSTKIHDLPDDAPDNDAQWSHCAADLQDREGRVLRMATMFGFYPFLLKLYADGGYQGSKVQQGLARVCRGLNIEIVRRCDTGKYVVLPKRWIVERTLTKAPQQTFEGVSA